MGSTRSRGGMVAALAVAALAAGTPAALAYTEKVEVTDVGGGHSGLKISQQAEPGQTAGSGAPVDNRLALRFEHVEGSDPMIVVQEGNPAAVLEPGNDCSTRSQTEVACGGAFVSRYRIFTGLGNDTVDLTQLTDKGILPATVDGGPGADAIVGGPEDDTFNGDGANGNGIPPFTGQLPNGGEDILVGGEGDDTLNGGPGSDILVGSSTTQGDIGAHNILNGDAGSDLFLVGWSLGADEVNGGTGAEDSSAVWNYLGHVFRHAGDEVSYVDRTFLTSGTQGVTVDLAGDANDGAPGEGDRIGADVESIDGSARDDTLTGNDADNRLVGELGKDRLVAGAGDDVLNLRDGVADQCPSAGTGANTISADLADQPVIDACTLTLQQFLALSIAPRLTLIFMPVDETTQPATIGSLKVRRGAVRARLKCPRSPQAACVGRLAIGRVRGGSPLARTAYRIRVGHSATVSLAVGVARLTRLHHAAKLTLVEHGRSHKGRKTVEVARRLP
jgi:hypothetical protein